MNDFTKEELKKIYNWGNYYCFGSHASEVKYKPLLDKIESMIEGYCEHDFQQVGCGDASYASCVKCGKIERLMLIEGS